VVKLNPTRTKKKRLKGTREKTLKVSPSTKETVTRGGPKKRGGGTKVALPTVQRRGGRSGCGEATTPRYQKMQKETPYHLQPAGCPKPYLVTTEDWGEG